MRWKLAVVGGVMDLLGTVWLLQGLNVLGGSPMTGVTFWAGAGVVMMAIGSAVMIVGLRQGDTPD